MFSSTSFAAVKNASKTPYAKSQKRQNQPVRTKEYKVPGAAAVGYAKKHGYKFPDGTKRIRIGNRIKSVKACKFMGMHWQVDSKKTCGIWGFSSPRGKSKCKKLRSGWKIKDMTINGNFVWSIRPVNTTSPTFRIWSENNSTKSKAVSVRYVTLIGPEGPANKWQEAFNHCSDRNYRP